MQWSQTPKDRVQPSKIQKEKRKEKMEFEIEEKSKKEKWIQVKSLRKVKSQEMFLS